MKRQAKLKVGLLGGSFNPAHNGHREISLLALKRLQLDFVWWLVSPQNPLKSTEGLKPLDERLAQARVIAHHPRVKVTALERDLKTRYTIDSLRALKRRFPHIDFVWLMGADNLRQFHRWKQWRTITKQMPLCVIDRPTSSLTALSSPAAQALKQCRTSSFKLMRSAPPAFVFLHGVKNKLSSTQLRAQQKSVSPTRL
jgi:nicotinate-nucleotide adenylyltransferase